MTYLEEPSISRARRKESEELMNELELRVFLSVNSKLSWLGTAASPIAAFVSSYLQQLIIDPKVKCLLKQINMLRKLKKLGTTVSYIRPKNGNYRINVVCFADANKKDEKANLDT